MPVQKEELRPLNDRFIHVSVPNGGNVKRPALDSYWVETVHFLNIPPLPIEWDEATVAEWQERLAYVEEDLKWLLKLPHHKFWSQNVYDTSLQKCLDSYLKNAPRYHDGEHQMPPSLLGKQKSIHRLVFLAFLRLSTHKESKEGFINPSSFGDLIYDNYIFDAVKLIELSVLYGGGNAELLKKMVENVFKNQPNYLSDLKQVVPTILEAFVTISKKCGLKQDSHSEGPAELTEPRWECTLLMKPIGEIQDIVFYVMDSALSIQSFLEIYPEACHIFFDQGFVVKVSNFCEVLLPHLARTVQDVQLDDERLRGDLRNKLIIAKVSLAKVCHLMIKTCCIQPALECSGREDEVIRHVERYLHTMSSILSDKMFLAAMAEQYSIQEDLELVLQSSTQVDEARTQFILDGVNSAIEMYSQKIPAMTPTVRQSEESAATNFTDDYQTDTYVEDHASAMGASAPRKTGVELESLITEVKDLLPGLGDGFLEICLEEYNYDTAKLINDILEGNLPPGLQELDRNIPRDAQPEPVHRAVADESDLLTSRGNVYDGDEFDIFAGQSVDTSKIHKGKKEDADLRTILADKSSLRDLRSTYEDYYYEYDDEYEDEYDDTYDTVNVGAQDKDSAEELTDGRPFTIPRVLQQQGRRERESEEDEGEEEDSPPPHPPRDEFVPRPPSQVTRGRGRGRGRGSAARGGGGGGSGRGGGQGGSNPSNRRGNERQKSSRANHNRKSQASKKRGRGMF
ncbi:activating signal cointegrator 1 complex subunit 2-like [Apostichopus japonicus]|uniref:activating signal cointegrator 1 complex subunit 2-like n=1 Tax=Stichopus japonicus TaxID=307972 RepID=UPI003AB55930